ncbi:MAG: DUF1538 family protein [Verrucomicrobia bacterium]|nr:DUF1538 family protein [Verrucomicrobiota bacterium]MCH8526892.1 DUF1538 domain-containing protein [Kiritimatiellia bacterium]
MTDNVSRIHIPFHSALRMLGGYFRVRVLEQIRSISFILVYLLGFQILVLGTTPANALQLTLGIGMVVFGLMFFLEGLILGLMPLGEQVGVQLPQKAGVVLIALFGLLLGVGATFAEPAIASLRAAGLSVTPWDAPLLYWMLERAPGQLVAAIGGGVGVAVAFGMLRFYLGLPIKPFVYVLIPLLLLVSVYCALDENLVSILGLAWDAGAVTTGAVTVPLVLALGIGISRATGKQDRATAGFGVVMLASAFPVLGVMLLGIHLNQQAPRPQSEADFFSQENRKSAILWVGSEEGLTLLAFERGTETGRQALFPGEVSEPHTEQAPPVISPGLSLMPVIRTESGHAVRSVLPLTFLLLVVLMLWLRSRPRHGDEVALGVFFAWLGMSLLTSGIRLGLAPLGDEVGRPLPRLFRSVAREEGRLIFEPFDPDLVFSAVASDGRVDRFFYLQESAGVPRAVPFDPERFDPARMRYEHILKRPPLFGPELTLAGIALVLMFAFGLGYGSTLAEPALRALGRTVEELTVGTIRRVGVVRAVSLGVGVGLVIGVSRILYDLPMIWLLLPPYLCLLPLTFWSDEDFAAIAWDCGGVTTGSITVPLVLAMGLGIGSELKVIDGFGVLAMASAYPIISVLLYGLWMQRRQARSLMGTEGDVDHE